jgi:hypothetical protein
VSTRDPRPVEEVTTTSMFRDERPAPALTCQLIV